jgi:hypothetical protein
MQREGGKELDDKLKFAFRRLSGRSPSEHELDIFRKMYKDEKQKFMTDREGAEKLLAVGERPVDNNLEPAETAALTMVVSMMINHDETYMKR